MFTSLKYRLTIAGIHRWIATTVAGFILLLGTALGMTASTGVVIAQTRLPTSTPNGGIIDDGGNDTDGADSSSPANSSPAATSIPTQESLQSFSSPQPYLRNQRLGIAHISAAEGGTSDQRYQEALTLGAYWNRYPIYWNVAETAPGTFDWHRYDIQVADDLSHQFGVNAILLGRPDFRLDGDRIQGLNEPVFADG
ncbi:MAG TPA: hypothetical protein VHL11_00250, partial [Phototrophicaceae bacterium]|nr:hypothetical protein [Phototrophicaceae bacterium]